ncbi:MAG: enoyl-CoA hydratase/isomerase family protein [Acidobacteria bacterium]|nr:enoyl-CoA hydratase/isomerase family protein [Acidobacteriota bacterium]MBI3655222.1 enoyl-CoA hydratase/isomerase family protein [Acidobacteriota bacterium]
MAFSDILYSTADNIATITINRPEKRNALRHQTVKEITAAVQHAAFDANAGVVVFRGAGEKAFCAGGDIEEMNDLTPESGRRFIHEFLAMILAIHQTPKPVLAAVRGFCIGGGHEICLVSDLVLAADDARFGQAGPKVGGVPLVSGTQLLPRIVGERRAREILFLCRQYTAAEAFDMGLINKVVPADQLDDEVQAWCETMLSLSPQALRVAKLSFNFESDQLYASYQHGVELMSFIYGTEEYHEGMRAFLEKRKPDFGRFRK